MQIEEYKEAGNNFRHFVILEKEYLQLFINTKALLIGGFWFVSPVEMLRITVCIAGIFIAGGILVTELRYATYFRHFFDFSVKIEGWYGGSQFSDITKYFRRPFLGIRSTNIIISFYIAALIFWGVLLISDIANFKWYVKLLSEISGAKSSITL